MIYCNYRDPETGIFLQDMLSNWFCDGIDSANRIAAKLTDIFGENFAVPVSYRTPKGTLEDIIMKHRYGEIPNLVCADLLLEGVDFPRTQLVMMTRTSNSQIVTVNAAGRALRSYGDKLAFIFNFINQGDYDVLTFDAVARKLISVPIIPVYHGEESNGRQNKTIPGIDYDSISGLDVQTTHLSTDDFVRKREEYFDKKIKYSDTGRKG